MERRTNPNSMVAVTALLLVLATVVSGGERVNKSASVGATWSTTKEEGDLLRWKTEADDDLSGGTVQEEEDRYLDGGFSSLEGMLQWSIGHSDPEKLKEATLEVQRLSHEELKQRQMEIKELMEKLKTPSDAELMKIAINDLNNLSLHLEDRHRALQELLILVEPIDNANDLHKLGGLTAVIKELNNPNPEIRTISAWILGKASQNNPFVQNQILDLGTLAKLMEMVQSEFTEEALKALYAISALIRNNREGQQLFYMEDGELMLQKILSNSSVDVRLSRKSVFLLADLVEHQFENINDMEIPFFSSRILLKTVVDLMASPDLDLQEKALYAVKNLLVLRSTDALVFKDVCRLDVALGRMRQQLEQLILDDKSKEYAEDMENLRREVELIFLERLDQILTPNSSILRQKPRRKPEVEIIKRPNNQLKTQKSMKDLESEELQGFKDLGFDFDKKDISPNVISIIPGLQEKKRIEEDEERRIARPYLSEAWAAPPPPPVPRWGGRRSTEDMKAQIKFWARAVASNVRQEC